MADLGAVGHNSVNGLLYNTEQLDFRHLERKFTDTKIIPTFTTKDIDDGLVVTTATTIKFNKMPFAISIPWHLSDIESYLSINCQLSAFAVSTYPTEKPSVYINGKLIKEGIISAALQTIDINYSPNFGDSIPRSVIVQLVYYSHYNYEAEIIWHIENTNGIVNSVFNTLSGGGSTNCPYPIGEEKPIDYGTITLTGSDTNELTFTIPADTVVSTITDAQILLTLSPYGSNVNGDIEDIFTELSGLYKKLYVKDSAVSLKIDTETWNDSDNFAKIWVTIPTLTTASKDLVLEFDSGSVDNPINTMLGLIGF